MNNKNLTGMELFVCLSLLECGAGMGYGLNSNCAVNNVCNGFCTDEGDPPGSSGVNFRIVGNTLCFAGQTLIVDATGDSLNGLDAPQAMATDSAGNVYVTGHESDNAFKITPDGLVTEIIDATGDGTNVLDGAFGIAVDLAGNVYVSGEFSDNVFQITPGGVITQVIDATGDGGSFPLDSPRHLAVDLAIGDVCVTGHDSNNVLVFAPGAGVFGVLDALPDGVNPLTGPYGVAYRGTNLYVSGETSNNVFLDAKGVVSQILDATGDGAGNGLSMPRAIAVDIDNNLYVAGSGSNNVFKVAGPGGITEIVDSTAGGAGFLMGPSGIAVDDSGNVYVTGGTSNNILKVSPTGGVTQIGDEFGTGSGRLSEPDGVAVDGNGNVFFSGRVSDNGFRLANCRIGNVNAVVGPITDVLMVNGSAGIGPDRRVELGRADPLTIFMDTPPSLVSANFAAYAFVGEPSPLTGRDLPAGIGTFCMPIPFTDSSVPPFLAPLEIWNNLGFTNFLGEPTRVVGPAPVTLASLPGGTERQITVFIQALIRDNDSVQGQIAVTNGVLIVVP